jgi:histidine triad (HIT) family protein
MNSSENCLFCKIVRREIPAPVIYEDDHTFAFLDAEPRTLGHTLVIPKYHAVAIIDLPENENGPLFSAVRKVAELLVSSLAAKGLTIGINQGEASGQVVGHVHVHIMPRFASDGGGSVQSIVHSHPEISLQEVQKLILKNKQPDFT